VVYKAISLELYYSSNKNMSRDGRMLKGLQKIVLRQSGRYSAAGGVSQRGTQYALLTILVILHRKRLKKWKNDCLFCDYVLKYRLVPKSKEDIEGIPNQEDSSFRTGFSLSETGFLLALINLKEGDYNRTYSIKTKNRLNLNLYEYYQLCYGSFILTLHINSDYSYLFNLLYYSE
jgi:hypothetical protein